jgi:membrane protein DedA with SNARE-associated domain
VLETMLYAVAVHHATLLGWLQTPHWFGVAARALGHFVKSYQSVGLFLVIFAEELGIPLPAPGDAAITYGGYLTTTGAIPYPLAFLAVVAGATTGSLCLYWLSRRYGHRFLVRFGPYIGLTPERLVQAERAFQRWGPWAVIIGRHIPGMRIVLSGFAGAFEIRARVFAVCVLVSSSIWAAIFLEVGRVLGRNSRFLFRIFPVHLVPLAVVFLALLWVLWLAHEQRTRRSRARTSPQASGGLPPKAEGRTAKM